MLPVVGSARRDPRDDLAVEGVVIVECAAARGTDPLTADVLLNLARLDRRRHLEPPSSAWD